MIPPNDWISQQIAPKKRRLGFHARRATWVTQGMGFLFAVVLVRSFYIHLFVDSKLLQKIANSQYSQVIHIAPYRGTLYDRRRSPMAISIRAPSIAVNPKVFDPTTEERRKLSHLLQMPESSIKKIEKKSTYFAWLKRTIPENEAAAIRQMDLAGLHLILEPARYYPGNYYASPLIGYVGHDGKGLLGLERQLDAELRGESLDIRHSVDARGDWILKDAAFAEPEPSGNSVHLTIDQVVQEIAEDALSTWVANSRAKHGFAIVADPYSGEILAMANYPRFNPNDTSKLNISDTQNNAISYTFEPASAVKPFLVARALENKITTENEVHNCENGQLRIGKKVIHDVHGYKSLTTAEILIHSSNIGIYKIAKRMGKEAVSRTFKEFGLTAAQPTILLPGASHGKLEDWRQWKDIRFANVAFGQGFIVTGLEMVEGYSALVNGGKHATPYLIEKITSPRGAVVYQHATTTQDSVLQFETSKTMRSILHRITMEAAPLAKTASYSTGGKTGTTQKVDPLTKKYGKDTRIASFIGFAPVDDPHIVVYVVIDEPQEKPYFGAKWAAPAFGEIVERTLQYMNVPADWPPQKLSEADTPKKDTVRGSTKPE